MPEQLCAAWKMAELAHPERPLQRGFARVTSRDGHTLTRARDAREAKLLTLRFGDGSVDAVGRRRRGTPRPVERKSRRSYIAPQPGLFDAGEE